MTIKFGATKEQFLESVRWAQCAAYLGLDTASVLFTAYREEGDSYSGKFIRTFYAMEDGRVVKSLTSKGFARANPDETAEVLALVGKE